MPCFNDHMQPLPQAVHVQPVESIPQCLAALEGLASAKPGDPRFAQADHLAFSHMVGLCRMTEDRAFVSPLEGWKPYTAEEARKITRHTASDPRKSDADVKLAQLYRITGLKGTAVLSRADYRTGTKGEGRMVTAQGRPTANVPNHLSGLCPSADLAVFQPSDGTTMTITGSEVRFLKRYRESMRGKAYATAMQAESDARTLAYWRAAFPWIPVDSHGKLWEGKRYNRADGIGDRIYSDGTMLSERKREYDATNPDMDGRAMSEAQRLRMIADLADQQREDDADTRKHSRRIRAENEERTRKALRF